MGLPQIALPLALAICLRAVIMMQPYSGQSKPPMFGDFEAQRHWMEITVNLPPSEWYTNSTINDLNYWGLDYPPLTAYHSYLLGLVARTINTSWIELNTSRGIEAPEHKRFMRICVMVADCMSFIFASLIYSFHSLKAFGNQKWLSGLTTSVIFISFPGLILIDHGHFQFNCVSLGYFLLSICLFADEYNLCGSIAFCFALLYKQMELYHALPIFFFLLAKCCQQDLLSGLSCVIKLAITVCSTFAVILMPFLSSFEALKQVGVRMFPIARGLYEDKVANFWCVSSIIIKWKDVLSPTQLVACCTLATLLFSLPACLVLFRKPCMVKLLLSEAIVSMSFFLFSYQVHEKSILLVAIPSLCLLPFLPLTSIYFSVISTLSMWPLLVKDGLIVATFALLCIFYTLSYVCLSFDTSRVALYRFLPLNVSLLGYFLIFTLEACIYPPQSHPFIFALLVSAYSFIHFVGFYVYWFWQLIKAT